MRCRFCGVQLEEPVDQCPRCRADLTRETRRHNLRVTCLYFVICSLLVYLLLFLELR